MKEQVSQATQKSQSQNLDSELPDSKSILSTIFYDFCTLDTGVDRRGKMMNKVRLHPHPPRAYEYPHLIPKLM
jgi:hypothetical protein